MNDTGNDDGQCSDLIFGFDISDEALEAAASAPTGALVSFPGAPTVSVFVSCCSNDANS
jgi:hypothetical protein